MKAQIKKDHQGNHLKVKILIGDKVYRITQVYPERLLISKGVKGRPCAITVAPSCENEIFIG